MTDQYRSILILLPFILLIGCSGSGSSGSSESSEEQTFATEEALGKALFNDINLSLDRTQSCATCHNPEHGFIDNRENEASAVGVSLGDDNRSLGTRNTPTAAYAQFSPVFSDLLFTDTLTDTDINGFVGGQFLDGRAADLKGQAGGPPLNPVEMNMPDKASVVERIKENGDYIEAFQRFYGENIFENVDETYLQMTVAIGKFEKTEEFAPFDSKWDRFLADEYSLTLAELGGMAIFMSPNNSSCVSCHLNDVDIQTSDRETFTNFK